MQNARGLLRAARKLVFVDDGRNRDPARGTAPSTRTTRPLQRTRMPSVSVISGGRVSVKSIAEPA